MKHKKYLKLVFIGLLISFALMSFSCNLFGKEYEDSNTDGIENTGEYYSVREAEVGVEIIKNNFGAPTGVGDIGKDVYIDFSTGTKTSVTHGAAAPAHWDMVFTYVLKDGPFGDIPFFALKINDTAGCSFYLVERQDPELEIDDVKIVSEGKFVDSNHTGYGHRDEGSNSTLDKDKYKTSFPYFSYDWYECISLFEFDFEAYPGRVFIVKTEEGKYAKFQVTKVYDDLSSTLGEGYSYKAVFKFHYMDSDGEFSN